MGVVREEVVGPCRLILGDARAVVPALGPLDAVVTDPPYGMAFVSGMRRVNPHAAIAGDRDGELLAWACALRPTHSAYVFCRWDNLGETPKPRSVVTWVKNAFGMGDLEHEHARKTETIAFYPGPDHGWPGKRPHDVLHAARSGNHEHPTQKPTDLMLSVVRWTRGVVVDPFMGSGSTLVACVRDGRRAIGVEVDPVHFETALRRVREAVDGVALFAGCS